MISSRITSSEMPLIPLLSELLVVGIEEKNSIYLPKERRRSGRYNNSPVAGSIFTRPVLEKIQIYLLLVRES